MSRTPSWLSGRPADDAALLLSASTPPGPVDVSSYAAEWTHLVDVLQASGERAAS
jgi:hypothetical protein